VDMRFTTIKATPIVLWIRPPYRGAALIQSAPRYETSYGHLSTEDEEDGENY